MMQRNWRDAKVPKWVSESIESDLEKFVLTAALSWPTEAKPEPLPFRWGEYDQLSGDPVEGVYYAAGYGRLSKVEIRKNEGLVESWKKWAFKKDGLDWSSTVVRSPLFATERDARLWLLWEECEECAKKLMKTRKAIYG